MDGEEIIKPATRRPQTSLGEEAIEDYVALSLSLKAHPVGLLRSILRPALCKNGWNFEYLGKDEDVLAKN